MEIWSRVGDGVDHALEPGVAALEEVDAQLALAVDLEPPQETDDLQALWQLNVRPQLLVQLRDQYLRAHRHVRCLRALLSHLEKKEREVHM